VSENDDLRSFIREITLRFERVTDAIMARMDESLRAIRDENRVYFKTVRDEDRAIREENRAFREENRAYIKMIRKESAAYFEKINADQKADRERLDEILAEGRAGRQALFHLLDELRGNGGPATAG
jgi:hypothetical protein